jgi:hypothetical protein
MQGPRIWCSQLVICLFVGSSQLAWPEPIELTKGAFRLKPLQTNTLPPIDKGMFEQSANGVTLRARTDPWGAETRTFAMATHSLGEKWQVECLMAYSGEIEGQRAGIFVGQPNRGGLLLSVQRPGSPFKVTFSRIDENGRTLDQVERLLPSYRTGDSIRLRIVSDGESALAAYQQASEWVQIGVIMPPPAPHSVGVGLIDLNEQHYEKRVSQGSLEPAEALFSSLTLSNKPDAAALAVPDGIYVRLKLLAVNPSKPTRIGFAYYFPLHETRFRAIFRDSGMVSALPATSPPGFPWSNPDLQLFTAGQTTPWINLTEVLNKEATGGTAVFSFWQDGRSAGPGARGDNGNTLGFEAEVEFATRPDKNSILKTIHQAGGTGSVFAIAFPPMLQPFREWCPNIVSWRDYMQSCVEAATKAGARIVTPTPNLEVIGSLGLGIHFQNEDSLTQEYAHQLLRLLGQSRKTLWLNEHPTSRPDMDPWKDSNPEFLKGLLQRATAFEDSDIDDVKRFYLILGDEPHIIRVDRLIASPQGVADFQSWLLKRGLQASSFEKENISEVLPIKKDDVKTTSDRRRYFATIWYLQEKSQALASATRQAAKLRYGDGVTVATATYYSGFDRTPDYFLESRLGASDRLMNHFGGERNPSYDLYNADMVRSAARFGMARPGMLSFASRASTDDGVALLGHLGLSRGLDGFRYYGIGPLASGWEWFSDSHYKTGAFAAASSTSGMAVDFEKYLKEGIQTSSGVATVLSRSADIWTEAPEAVTSLDTFGHTEAREESLELAKANRDRSKIATGRGVERNMIHAGLSRSGFPADVLPEEEIENGRLDTDAYRVLYISDVQLSRRAQEQLVEWVRRGGVLYLGPKAATQDEYNEPSDLASTLLGITNLVGSIESQTAEKLGNPTFTERDIDRLDPLAILSTANKSLNAVGAVEKLASGIPAPDKVFAKWTDNSPAVAAWKVKQGWLLKSTTPLGALLARSAHPSLAETRPLQPNYGAFDGRLETYPTWRRDFGAAEFELLLAPVTLANIKAPVTTNRNNVDIGIFETQDGRGMAVFVGDFNPKPGQPLTIAFPTALPYSRARSFSGAPVAWDSKSRTITLAQPQTVEAIELLP